MTYASCRPLPLLTPVPERDQTPDRLVELLDCLADLLVEIGRLRIETADRRDVSDQRVQAAVTRLADLERSLYAVGGQAAGVHQLLQQVHLI